MYPDPNALGAGTTWYDVSNNSTNLTIPAGDTTWLVPYVGKQPASSFTGILTNEGGRVIKTRIDTGTTVTVAVTDHMVVCNNASPVTCNLPTLATAVTGRAYYIKNKGAGTTTVTPNGAEKIDNDSSVALAQYASLTIISDGAAWQKIT